MYGEALARLKREQELFNQAQDTGVKLTAKMADELRTRAATMGAKDYENTRKAADDASNPAVIVWETQMNAVQRPLPWASSDAKWTEAPRIFSLSEQ